MQLRQGLSTYLWKVQLRQGLSTYLWKVQLRQGLQQASMQVGREKTPGCGARGVGAPPLMSTSLDMRRERRLASTTAKEHLCHNRTLWVYKQFINSGAVCEGGVMKEALVW